MGLGLRGIGLAFGVEFQGKEVSVAAQVGAIDDYCIGAALNTEVDVEINNRQDKFPLVTEAMEAGRPTDHHEATLRLLLNGLIATVDIPTTAPRG